MHFVDLISVNAALISFFVFFFLQLSVFRILHQEAVLKAIMIIFLMASAIHAAGYSMILMTASVFSELTTAEKVLSVVVSYVMFAIAGFVYILCVFGPSETSIRIRVIREVYEAPDHSLSAAELNRRYNAKMILERRLDRLVRSGEIISEHGKFRLIKKANFFFMIDTVANLIQGVIRRP